MAAGEAIFGPGVARRLATYFAQPAPAGVDGRSPSCPSGSARSSTSSPAAGRTREITGQLGLSPKTVRNHVSNIFAKLPARDRAEAIVMAREAGMGGEAGRRLPAGIAAAPAVRDTDRDAGPMTAGPAARSTMPAAWTHRHPEVRS